MTRVSFTVAAVLLSTAACVQKSEPGADQPSADTAIQPTAPPSEPTLNDLPAAPAGPAAPAAPWKAAPIAASSIPPVYLDVWRVAENRSRCALLAPVSLRAEDSAAVPRKATFSGGWAVAYDLPRLRSAFGIAGSGSDPRDPNIYAKWPHNISWPDSSSAGYGPEAGTGPKWLAYVKIPGQMCLYNVWSWRGQSHLEGIMESLRFVAAGN